MSQDAPSTVKRFKHCPAMRFGQNEQIASPLDREVAHRDQSATTLSLLRLPSAVLE